MCNLVFFFNFSGKKMTYFINNKSNDDFYFNKYAIGINKIEKNCNRSNKMKIFVDMPIQIITYIFFLVFSVCRK